MHGIRNRVPNEEIFRAQSALIGSPPLFLSLSLSLSLSLVGKRSAYELIKLFAVTAPDLGTLVNGSTRPVSARYSLLDRQL